MNRDEAKNCKMRVSENNVRVVCNISLADVFKEFYERMGCIHDNLFEAIDYKYDDYVNDCCNELVAFIIISDIFNTYVKEKGIDLHSNFVGLDVVVHRGKNNEQ